MYKLTNRQKEILLLIKKEIEDTGFPPTRAEISNHLGFKSTNAAEEHLQALAKKGAIKIFPGTSRGIRLLNFSESQTEIKTVFDNQNKSDINHFYLLPLVGRVSAGSPILSEEHITQTHRVDQKIFSKKPDYLLKVRGMSMKDAGILDGDLLAVKKVTEVKNEQIIVARIDDEVTVKRFRRSGFNIELIPENKDYRKITINPEKNNFELEGLAVGLLRAWV